MQGLFTLSFLPFYSSCATSTFINLVAFSVALAEFQYQSFPKHYFLPYLAPPIFNSKQNKLSSNELTVISLTLLHY